MENIHACAHAPVEQCQCNRHQAVVQIIPNEKQRCRAHYEAQARALVEEAMRSLPAIGGGRKS